MLLAARSQFPFSLLSFCTLPLLLLQENNVFFTHDIGPFRFPLLHIASFLMLFSAVG